MELALEAVEATSSERIAGQTRAADRRADRSDRIAVDLVPPVRFVRLMVEKLSDEDLAQVYQRAMFTAARPALRKLAVELLGRKSLEGKFERAAIFGLLAGLETDSNLAVKWLGEARAAAKKAGQYVRSLGYGRVCAAAAAGRRGREFAVAATPANAHGKEPGVRRIADAIAIRSRQAIRELNQ